MLQTTLAVSSTFSLKAPPRTRRQRNSLRIPRGARFFGRADIFFDDAFDAPFAKIRCLRFHRRRAGSQVTDNGNRGNIRRVGNNGSCISLEDPPKTKVFAGGSSFLVPAYGACFRRNNIGDEGRATREPLFVRYAGSDDSKRACNTWRDPQVCLWRSVESNEFHFDLMLEL